VAESEGVEQFLPADVPLLAWLVTLLALAMTTLAD
jgi:hypothetical protein